MALPASLDFNIKFDLSNAPANFELQDATDYTALGIALADVRGNFANVTDPVGNVFHNNTNFATPDITASSSLLYTGIDIPTDINSDIIEGQYSFTYNIVVDDPIVGLSQGVTPYFTIGGNHVAQILLAGTITVVRSTGNNGIYNVSAAYTSGVETVIEVVEPVPSGTIDGSVQYSTQTVYSKTKTTTYSDLVPAVNIETQTDCFCGVLKSIDRTNYGIATIISRTHTVKYPAALAIADIVSANAIITVSPIYTKTWVTIIETTVSIDLGNGNTISAIITGSKDTLVECDLTLCDISCCVLALNNRYIDNRTNNPRQAEIDFKNLNRIFQLIEMFQMFNSCSQFGEASSALSEIKTIGNCSDSCVCTDESPAIVIPLCTSTGGGANINIVPGTGITITTSLVNGNYTYQVSLATSILNIINSVKPQNILAGTGIGVSYALVGGVDTWTITNTAAYTAQNRMDFLCRIQYTAPTTATITNSSYLISGPNINTSATTSSTTLPTAAANNNFRVSNFQIVANNNYKVTTELVIVNTGGSVYTLNSLKPFHVEVLNKTSGQFDFRFISSDNSNITNNVMFETSDIYVNIKISE